MNNTFRSVIAVVFSFFLVGPVSRAADYTFTVDDHATGQGKVQVRERVALSLADRDSGKPDKYDSASIFRIGVNDHLDLSVTARATYKDVPDGRVDWDGISLAARVFATDPKKSPVGFGNDTEFTVADDRYDLKDTLIAERYFGRLNVVANVPLSMTVDRQKPDHDLTGSVGFGLGTSYNLGHNWSAGAEALATQTLGTASDHLNVYAGPVVAYNTKNWFVAFTPMFKAYGQDADADMNVRLIVGLKF